MRISVCIGYSRRRLNPNRQERTGNRKEEFQSWVQQPAASSPNSKLNMEAAGGSLRYPTELLQQHNNYNNATEEEVQMIVASEEEVPASASIQEEDKNNNQYDHRFQRTDQWMPVYSWLESLDADEVVKSKDIIDWLTANPHIREHLYSRHSRYHLMHYIKKCHVKILKRKEKKHHHQPGTTKVHSESIRKSEEIRVAVQVEHMGNNLSSPPQDNEIYKAKQKEALQKYETLVELEKQLLSLFPKGHN